MAASNRVNITLDDEHAAKLQRMAERTHLNPGTLARSLLATAIDDAETDPRSVAALLDSIPGAWERVQEGLADARAGRFIPLEDL
jgi:predicted transcriptional regulator